MTQVRYQTVDVDGYEIFYREAGDRSRPTLLLLHGFRRPDTCSGI